MFVYSVRVMAALFYSASFKWTVVDMFDYGVVSVITLIFHDRKGRRFDDFSVLKQSAPCKLQLTGFSPEICELKVPLFAKFAYQHPLTIIYVSGLSQK